MTRIPLQENTGHLPSQTIDYTALAGEIRRWAGELGFQQTQITSTDLGQHRQQWQDWLAKGYQAGMDWLNDPKRGEPEALIPGTHRIITLRMDYLPPQADITRTLSSAEHGYIARYALGRDYHKVVRKRVQLLADKIQAVIGDFGYRAFVDSAPVLEKALAERAGMGWMGKHTLILNRHAGSYFFLAELFTDLPLPVDAPVSSHCGSCSACMSICPTQAIVAPYQLDAGKCISYLTIEYRGVIAEPLRRAMGNRIFGCDDCQLVCPWNRYARISQEAALLPKGDFAHPELLALWAWDEATWLKRSEGMPLRRLNYATWLRNLSIALGNAPRHPDILQALRERHALLESNGQLTEVLDEHLRWAIEQQQ